MSSTQVNFVRTVLGDIAAAELGVCDAHEHVIIDSPHIARNYPDLLLADVDRAIAELTMFREAGGRSLIDTMPGGTGRQPTKLAELSRRSGVHIVAPTGRHLAQYYPSDHPMLAMDADTLAAFFVREISDGMISEDGSTTPQRAGVIKVAGGREHLDDTQRQAFIAAASAQQCTGCPIITHTEQGTAAMEQVDVLARHGAALEHVVLSHVDRIGDVTYHRDLLQTGVRLEYDAAFRWPDRDHNPTIDLLTTLLPEFPTQLMVGMDIARRRYWHSYGGGPGLVWLVRELPDVLRQRGVTSELLDRLYVHNPAAAFTFAATHAAPPQPTPANDSAPSI